MLSSHAIFIINTGPIPQYDLESPKSADIRDSGSADSVSNGISSALQNSFVGDLESTNAYHAKQANFNLPASELFEPQAGLSARIASMMEYHSIAKTMDTDSIVSELESLFALFVALKQSVSRSQAAAILFLYFKTHCKASVLSSIVKYFEEEFHFPLTDDISVKDSLIFSDSDDDLPHRDDLSEPDNLDFDYTNDDLLYEAHALTELPDWLTLMKDLKTDWTRCIHNHAFKKVSKLISMCASIGLCDLAHFDIDVSGIRIFSIPTYKQHVTAGDLLSSIVDTVTYFIEGGYKCYTTKSLSPFIFSDDEARDVEAEYFAVMDIAPFMRAGTMLKHCEVTESDYDLRLEKLTDKLTSLHAASEGTWEKKLLFDRLRDIRKVRSDFTSFRMDGKLRECPFGAYIQGAPGVGKSVVSAILMRCILESNEFCADDNRMITLKEGDKYMSNMRGYVNGVFIDDIGNTVSEFIEKSPTDTIIELMNNIAAYANMAEVELKAKVPLEPKAVVFTSNLWLSIIAKRYSNEPLSIVRRAGLHIEQIVRPEFATADGRLDSDLVRAHYGGKPPVISDCWTFNVFKPDGNGDRRLLSQIPGKQGIDIYDLIDLCITMSRTHFESQRFVVEMGSNMNQKLDICQTCHRPRGGIKNMCTCCKTCALPLTACSCMHPHALPESISACVDTLIEQVRHFDSPWLRWTNWMPEWVFDNRYFDYFLAISYRNEISEMLFANTCIIWFFLFLSVPTFFVSVAWGLYLCFMSVFMYTFVCARSIMNRRSLLLRRLKRENNLMPVLFKRIRDNHVAKIAALCSVFGVVYTLVKLWRRYRTIPIQGKLEPITEEDVRERDAEVNPWAGSVISKRPVSESSKTTVFKDLLKLVGRNLCYIEIEIDGGRRVCDALFLESNVALIPTHILDKPDLIANFIRSDPCLNGASFKCPLSTRYSVAVPQSDLSLVWVPNGGSFKNLVDYLSIRSVPKAFSTMVYKDSMGEIQHHETYIHSSFIPLLQRHLTVICMISL